MSFKDLVRKAKIKTSKTPSAVVAIEESLLEGYGAISFDLLREKTEVFLRALEKSSDGDHDRTEFFMSLADLFFSATLTYDGSGKEFLHPSSFMDDCQRKLHYDLTGTEYSNATEPITTQLQRIFDFGTIIHVYIQYHLYRKGVLAAAEAAAVRPERRIRGKADGLLSFSFYRGGKKILLEIKTANSFSFSKAKREPLLKHKRQTTVYANALGIDQVLFVYINKDTSEMAEHLMDVDPAITAETELVMREVVESVETGTAPSRSCRDAYTNNALNCPYRDHCFNLTPQPHAEKKESRRRARNARKPVSDDRQSSEPIRKSRVRRRK